MMVVPMTPCPTDRDIRLLLRMVEAGVYLSIPVSQSEPALLDWPEEWRDLRREVLQWNLRYRANPALYARRYRATYPEGMTRAQLTASVEQAIRLLEAAVWEEGESPSFAQLSEADEALWEAMVEVVFECVTAGTEEAVKEQAGEGRKVVE